MSDRMCNHCTVKALEKMGEVQLRPRPIAGMPDGVEVFIKYPGQKEPAWAAWFGQVSEECAC